MVNEFERLLNESREEERRNVRVMLGIEDGEYRNAAALDMLKYVSQYIKE